MRVENQALDHDQQTLSPKTNTLNPSVVPPPNMKSLHPKPETRNPKPETRNPKPEARKQRVGKGTSLGGVPREQKTLKEHLPRVTYHQVYWCTKTNALEREE